jgi:hypothetical protein
MADSIGEGLMPERVRCSLCGRQAVRQVPTVRDLSLHLSERLSSRRACHFWNGTKSTQAVACQPILLFQPVTEPSSRKRCDRPEYPAIDSLSMTSLQNAETSSRWNLEFWKLDAER